MAESCTFWLQGWNLVKLFVTFERTISDQEASDQCVHPLPFQNQKVDPKLVFWDYFVGIHNFKEGFRIFHGNFWLFDYIFASMVPNMENFL